MDSFHDVKNLETLLKYSDFGNFSCFLFCQNGSMRILLNNRIYDMERNAICMIPPFSSLRFISMSDDVEGWITMMDMKDITDAVLEMPLDAGVNIRKESLHYVTDVYMERLLGIKAAIDDRFDALDEDGYFMAGNVILSLRKAFCYEAIQASAAGIVPEEAAPDRKKEIFYSFLASANVKFASQKRVYYYAEEQNLSPAYLSEVIKEVSGRSAKDWLENLSFSSAVHYLKNPNFPVSEVAWLLNFRDQSSFGKFFRKMSGCSPADFRRRYLR